MSFSLDGYRKKGEGADSEVFLKDGNPHVLKIYKPGISPRMIESYHRRHRDLSRRLYKPLESWKSNEDLCNPHQEVTYLGDRVQGMTCYILDLNPDEVFFGKVDGFYGPRVIARARFIPGDNLKGVDSNDPIITEIETRLCRTGVPIGKGLGVFTIDPMNVKVLRFQDRILNLMITDLGANIKVSMAGCF